MSGPIISLRFLRFLVAGGINTCFGYAAFAFFIWTGLPNDIAVTCSMIAGMLFNFGTFGKVFAAQGLSRLPAFMIVYGTLLVANIYLLRFFVAAGFGPYLGQGLVVMLITPASFLALRRFVFAATPELQT